MAVDVGLEALRRRDGRAAVAAIPDDFCGDTLRNLASSAWVYQQREVTVGVDIDKTWRYHAAIAIQ